MIHLFRFNIDNFLVINVLINTLTSFKNVFELSNRLLNDNRHLTFSSIINKGIYNPFPLTVLFITIGFNIPFVKNKCYIKSTFSNMVGTVHQEQRHSSIFLFSTLFEKVLDLCNFFSLSIMTTFIITDKIKHQRIIKGVKNSEKSCCQDNIQHHRYCEEIMFLTYFIITIILL